MKKMLLFAIALLPAWLAAQTHLNVRVSQDFDANEPSICLDPKNPAHIVAGANLNNVYHSTDTGRTWTAQLLTSAYGVWGDPVIGVDTSGDFYFLHLSNPPGASWIDRIVCQKSTDWGLNWSPGTFMGLNGTKAQDKHWIAVNRTTNHLFVTWTEFDTYGSSNPQDSSRILFSKSTDGGNTWSAAKRLNKVSGNCIDSDDTTEGAVPCIGPNGEIYVSWAGPEGLRFDRSTDGGESWLENDLKIDDMPGGWDYQIPGLERCNGLPVTSCDLSNGPHRGTIYVNWADQRNGPADTDVWLAKSTDGGNTWSAPIRVNDDAAGRHQFLTWMAVDQATGWLWLVFYDRRGYADNQTEVYMALSRDGGATFRNFKISDAPFTPNTGNFFGDYNNLTVYNNIVRPIWTRMEGVSTDIWTALVDVEAVITTNPGEQEAVVSELEQNYPNPATVETWIPFKIRHRAAVTLQIATPDGKVLHTVFENRIFTYGKYTERVPLKEMGLPAGTYLILLSSEEKVLTKRMVVVTP
ncbi:MAG: T9SS type A sorting domain-containing protein [Saprospiraceae bacterium]|nr:T9SS type A sorting domain-containing protein [Saprospiraceae bacterium]